MHYIFNLHLENLLKPFQHHSYSGWFLNVVVGKSSSKKVVLVNVTLNLIKYSIFLFLKKV